MEEGRKPARGLIIGKFLPPHLGHQYLVDFARRCVEKLTVLVCTLEREPIPGRKRFEWMREMFPDVEVLHNPDENPQEPHEHPDFWNIWRDSIRRFCPEPDVLFASEAYGWKLAETLGARFWPVNIARGLVPVSGTKVREDPMAHWEFIPPVVRPWFVRRVCIVGPESAGKSTLGKRLAEHFGTSFVHEYARDLLETKPETCDAGDFEMIAHGQIASEDALARQANRLLVCDTDTLTTVLWAEILLGSCPAWIRKLADTRCHDLYLLLDCDVPWVGDWARYQPVLAERQVFFGRMKSELEARGRRYVIIRGGWEDRFAAAVAAVETMLGELQKTICG
ncbi:MAG: Trifunctional NAD biosynthesis/regulator protein NadR [bacterium ADurb.Bin374]|nr:MAG: Trifunctional NAD biosynthesis/regulator protein NadR [bacterium ADurb.Bin374]